MNCQWLRPQAGGWALCEVPRCREAGRARGRVPRSSGLAAGSGQARRGRRWQCTCAGQPGFRRPQLHRALPGPLDPRQWRSLGPERPYWLCWEVTAPGAAPGLKSTGLRGALCWCVGAGGGVRAALCWSARSRPAGGAVLVCEVQA